MSFQIRPATPADADALARLGARLFEQSFGAANTPGDMASHLARTFNAPRQRAELELAESRIWLVESERGEAIGYGFVTLGKAPAPSLDIASLRPVELVRFYVDPGWHGTGLAAALMERVVAAATAWRGDCLWLGVWERNPRAIAFYEKHGFKRVGTQDFMLGSDRQRDLVMIRRLETT